MKTQNLKITNACKIFADIIILGHCLLSSTLPCQNGCTGTTLPRGKPYDQNL